MVKDFVHYIFLSLLTPLVLVSCVADKGANKDANCGANQVFDVVARRCVASQGASVQPHQPPVATTTSATITEDTPGAAVTLNYTDVDGDLATSCSIVSYDTFVFSGTPPTCNCAGGYCYAILTPDPDKARTTSFTYNITEPNDGTSLNKTVIVTMINVNDYPTFGGMIATAYAGFEDNIIPINSLPAATDIDCDIGPAPLFYNETNANCPTGGVLHYSISSYSRVPNWTGTPPTFLGNILRNCMGANGSALNDLDCDLYPENHFNGSYQFTYQANDGWGNSIDAVTVTVTVTSVNDQPVASCSNCTITVPEDGINAQPQDPVTDRAAMTFQITNSGGVPGVTGIAHTYIDVENTAGLDDDTLYNECVISNNLVPGLSLNSTGVGSCLLDWDITAIPSEFNKSGVLGTFDVSFCDDGDSGDGVPDPLEVLCSAPITITVEAQPKNDNPIAAAPAVAGTFDESPTSFASDLNMTLPGSYPHIVTVPAATVVEAGEVFTYDITQVDWDLNNSSVTGSIAITGGDFSDPTIPFTLSSCMNSSSALNCIFEWKNNHGNYDGTVTVYYSVTDDEPLPNTGSASSTFDIQINAQTDQPVLCQYSRFIDAKECGLKGCRGSGSPTHNGITPSSHTMSKSVVWYDESTSSCYRSTSASTWSVVSSYIPSQAINEKDILYIRNLVIDEGGTTPEDASAVTISNVSSSNPILIQNNNIFFNNGEVGEVDTPTFYTWDAGAGSSDAHTKGYIKIVPTGTTAGTATITFDVTTTVTTTVSFDVTVNPVSIQHNDWKIITAAGPTINKYGEVKSVPKVCSYSRDKCNGGQECTGVTAPTMPPDGGVNNAIYWASGSQQCYYYTGDQPVNEKQEIELAGTASIPDVGTFRLVFNGQQTGPLAYNATAADVKSALESLSSIGAGNVNVTINTVGPVVTYEVEFIGAFAGLAQPLIILTNNLLLDNASNAIVATITQTQTASGLAANSWQPFTTTCPITDAAFEPACGASGSNSCLVTANPDGSTASSANSVEGTTAGAVIGSTRYNISNGSCWVYAGYSDPINPAPAEHVWNKFVAPGEARIGWENFTLSGTGTISGYWVYRRVAGEEFDYDFPLNKTLIPLGTTTYVDNATNSWSPPLPNVAYYYEVRPVVNGIPTKPVETYAQARLIVPNNNHTFMSRRIANKLMCEKLFSPSDKTNHNRCVYVGPGDSNPDNSTYHSAYYDIGTDMIVERFEAGCPYSQSVCNNGSTTDTHCIGMVDPTSNITSSATEAIYYNRSNGTCYYTADSGGSWTELTTWAQMNSVTNLVEYTASELPPLTRITQNEAAAFCPASPDHAAVLGHSAGSFNKSLPSRKQQMAYSQWDTSTLNDTQISSLETGLSLNTTAKCNSSNASGLTGYSDTETPDSSSSYSIPGTASSMIRSVATGSNVTSACQSFAGVQDAVGNVAEWTSSTFTSQNQVQRITFGMASFFLLTFKGETTDTIIHTTSGTLCAEVETELEQLSVIDDVNIVGSSPTHCDIEFVGSLAGSAQPLIEGTYVPSMATFSSVVQQAAARIADASFRTTVNPAGTANDSVLTNVSYTISEGPVWPGLPASLSPIGPCNDTDANGTCDGLLGPWVLENRPYDADRFFIPMGLPVHRDFNDNVGDPINNPRYPAGHPLAGDPVGTISSWAKVIGQTSGITSAQLHGDTVNFNESNLGGAQAAMVTGGSYKDGAGAGLYRFLLQPASGYSDVETGFRCVTTVSDGGYSN